MNLLARGRDAEIFDLGEGRVLRRYRGPRQTAREAAVMAHARAAGFPVPEAEAVSERELILERIEGPTMLEDLGRRPWTVLQHAHLLTALHKQLHRIDGPPWLRAFGDGRALLHLDLHPANVILSSRGPVVIDWTSAARGPGAADAAYAWVIMATSDIPPGPGRLAVEALRGLFIRTFLAGFDPAAVRGLLPFVARTRLEDANVRDSERARVRRLAGI